MFFRRRRETLQQMRQRLIRETELALLIGLRRPDHAPRIPAKEVGSGGFDPAFAEAFWSGILGDVTELAAHGRYLEEIRAERRYEADTPHPADDADPA